MQKTKHLIDRFDVYQQKHRWLSFPLTIIKKYGDDQVGNKAALLTYYGFLALFPLLLVLATVVQIIATYTHNTDLSNNVISAATSYFPVLGDQLSGHIHTLHKSGFALLVGVLFTLYGATGVASAFRQGVNQIWGVKRSELVTFPKSILKNLTIIVVGGTGFILAAILSGYAAKAGHGLGFTLLSLGISLFMLFWLFVFLLHYSLPKRVGLHDIWLAALLAAIGLVFLQFVGTYLLTNHLKRLDALYSYFALALGLLFWIYLQAQVVLTAVVIAVLHNSKAAPQRLFKSGAN